MLPKNCKNKSQEKRKRIFKKKIKKIYRESNYYTNLALVWIQQAKCFL